MKPYLQADLDIAARTIWGEARGETFAGQKAVAHVLLNRWNADTGVYRRHDTLATACLWNAQFSIWTPGDPNFKKLFAVRADDPAYQRCLRALLTAMDESDPTEGSLHYCTLATNPGWAEDHAPIVRIGGHKFFNDIE